ncbi:MAG: hypothetical protein CMC33_02565 [Flavobacteriaceae bacterium]|nr:hypothetical protein [Flavobacteriaceae bacterium]|tara:strand:+ start:7045 stop:7986 length:942 start_codon:yes stop_codon:yes gene_type:complete
MKILLTSTSFDDTPGLHHKMLKSTKYHIDKMRGPLKEDILLEVISEYDGLICGDDELTERVIKKGASGNLKVISKYGIGIDKIDIKAVKKYNIILNNTPGVNHVAVAEHIIALIFSFYKNIHLQHIITKNSKWERMIGTEVSGKKIGIVGLGRIGKELSLKAEALGLIVSGFDPYIDEKVFQNNKINLVTSLENLVKDIDIMVLTLPLSTETNGLINSDLIELAEKKILIVNTSRALIVNQLCLIDWLSKDKISGYLTDVLEEEPMINDHPLCGYDNVLITPHVGSRTYESVERQGLMSVENLINSFRKLSKN